MRRTHAAALLMFLVAGCASAPVSRTAENEPMPFSAARPGGDLLGWVPVKLMRLKKMTEYALVEMDGTTVLKAFADASASGLKALVSVDLQSMPWLQWRWKVPQEITGAINTEERVEDAAARVIVTFEGTREQLPPEEQMNYDMALAMTGNRMPFATLMYIWENRLPEGTIITHHMTSRVKMVVAGGPLGSWHDERRNVLADYRRAFGEDPPRVSSVGIMSDSDNSGTSIVAFYGDIRFSR